MWNIEAITGYKPQTTFWNDFSIADVFGEKAVRDTYKVSFKCWKENHVYLTELSMVLNHKIWQHYHLQHETLARLYDELWKKTDNYAIRHLKGEELKYYYDVTD